MNENETKNTYEANGEPMQNTEKPKKSKGFWWKVVALALCCSIIGGVIGAGCMSIKYRIFPNISISGIFDDDDFSLRRGFRYRFPFNFSFGNIDDFEKKIEKGLNPDSYIGVSVTDSKEPKGALVKDVEKNSPAETAGIQKDDIITAVNSIAIRDVDKLISIVEACDSGDELNLTIQRQDTTLELNVVVGGNSNTKKF